MDTLPKAKMKKILPLLLVLLLPACSTPQKKGPYQAMVDKIDEDEERDFFYGSWLHAPPDDDSALHPRKPPQGIANP